MDPLTNILSLYILAGLLMILYNRNIGSVYYKFVLFYTDKLSLKEVFIFKIDRKNRDSMMFLTRAFTISFGLFLISFSSYALLV